MICPYKYQDVIPSDITDENLLTDTTRQDKSIKSDS